MYQDLDKARGAFGREGMGAGGCMTEGWQQHTAWSDAMHARQSMLHRIISLVL
jgi:hypothetical protein